MRLWFDEDLSPTLVQVAPEHGLEATCNRDRGVLGHTDAQLRQLVQSQGYVLVTDNASDSRPVYGRDEVHSGIIVIPGGDGRRRQQQPVRAVIAWILKAAAEGAQTATVFMINTLVEIDSDGMTTAYHLPAS